MTRLAIVGDALLDRDLEGSVERLSPEGPYPVVEEPRGHTRPGGAGLAAVLAARDGYDLTLITALARDAEARELEALLAEHGVAVVALRLEGPTPEKVRVRAGGTSLVRIDRGAGGIVEDAPLPEAAREALESADAVLVSDYGRGMVARARDGLAAAARGKAIVWDPHPRGAEPVSGVRLATPNRDEALLLTPDILGSSVAALTARAHALVERWRATAVAVTLGEAGALLSSGDGLPLMVPAPPVAVGDACGAGDRFAVSAATALARGALPSEAVVDAVHEASAFVAAGGAAHLPAPQAEPFAERAEDLVERIRARGGTVVATSGCFDLLHAGHVATLRGARDLGDCLVVCLNSDDSVRRLKGPNRPLVPQAERAAVLGALEFVDAVVVFDEDTPEAVLERLRPDIFAKGGDYAVGDLPEARLLARWGGQAVVLPYVSGRSTTELMEEMVRRATG
jgi:D-beta-D-heptose 7-phosphate kinase/D-beta-D-heptose 1-phosphate adenosyltransferase